MIPLEPLRVQFRETIRADGTVHEERLAFCHAVACWVALARCKACDACAHVSGDLEPIVICRLTPVGSGTPPGSIRAHLARSVWCIEANARAGLARLMPTSQAEAIVVDGDGHAIGLLSQQAARRAEGNVHAHTAMEPAVVALLEGARLECARDLLSKGGVRTLPLLSAGRVIGCVDADCALPAPNA